MMTQGGLEGIPLPLERTMSDLEMRIMADIVRSIKINGFSTAKADWQLQRLMQLGESKEKIKKWIKNALEATDEEIERIFSDEVYEQYYKYKRFYDPFGSGQIPFEKNLELQALITAVLRGRHMTSRSHSSIVTPWMGQYWISCLALSAMMLPLAGRSIP